MNELSSHRVDYIENIRAHYNIIMLCILRGLLTIATSPVSLLFTLSENEGLWTRHDNIIVIPERRVCKARVNKQLSELNRIHDLTV